MIETLETVWCSVMHDAPMWPIHGHYTCRVCGREYPVQWSEAAGERIRLGAVRIFDRAMAGSHR